MLARIYLSLLLFFAVFGISPTFACRASAQNTPEILNVGSMIVSYVIVPRESATVQIVAPRLPSSFRKVGSELSETIAPEKGSFLLEMVRFSNPIAALSGGYLSSFEPPVGLGLLKIDGRVLQPAHSSWLTSGVFCTSGHDWQIARMDKPAAYSRFETCLQAGPLLIWNGELRYSGEAAIGASERRLAVSRQDQAFLCLRENRDLVLGIASGGDSRELASALKARLGCFSVLRLSGDITAGFWTRSGGLVGNNSVRLTNGIFILER